MKLNTRVYAAVDSKGNILQVGDELAIGASREEVYDFLGHYRETAALQPFQIVEVVINRIVSGDIVMTLGNPGP